MLTSLDLFLLAVAALVMVTTLSRRWGLLRRGRGELLSGDWKGLLRYSLGQERLLRHKGRGIAHLMVSCGLLFPVVMIILSQFPFTIPPVPSKVLSLLLDLAGAAFFLGIVFFARRRMQSEAPRGDKKRALFSLILLMVILLTGFMAEGSRLKLLHAPSPWEAPLGWIFSQVVPQSPLFMQVSLRIHFLAVLLLMATIASGPVRHMVVAPLNIYYRRKIPTGAIREARLEQVSVGANRVEDFSWKQLLDVESCVDCGRCEESCPAFLSGKPLSPRKVIQDILHQMEAGLSRKRRNALSRGSGLESCIGEDEIWSCTTCMACVEECPIFIEPLDKIIELRRYRVMGKGALPREARAMLRNLEVYGDVHGRGLSYREDWAYGREVPTVPSKDGDTNLLLWVGCFGAFHPRYQEAYKALVGILKVAGVTFGILGKEEICCGDPARRMGEEGLFVDIARKNMSVLKGYGIKRILTLCPHCYNTLKNEYPRVAGNGYTGGANGIEVFHATEYVMELMENKVIQPRYPVKKTVALHDPCYLGRANLLYDPPRRILRSLPGTGLRELARARDKGFCCGGGGGAMWLKEGPGRRINLIRAEEVLSKEAGILATSCPYCMIMLDDGLKALQGAHAPEVLDVMEILAYSLGSMEIEG